MVDLHFIDWAVIVGYFSIAVVVGILLSKRASRNINEFFLTGRSLPWWIAGTSMIATSFAADTPLLISGWVRDFGIWKNWGWWCFCVTGMFGTFLFARWWRRGEVMTKAEVAELRYGSEGELLRKILGVLHSLVVNTWTLCWVMLAAAKILEGLFAIDKVWSVAIACALAMSYSVLSGMWGVVMTDMLQLTMALVGAIFLAVICWEQAGGESILTFIHAQPGLENVTAVLPAHGPEGSFWTTPLIALFVYFGVYWWAVESVDGSGTTVQRVSASKNETHGMLAVLWFNLIHYAVRPWPWIVVGLASLVVLPNLEVKSQVDGIVTEITADSVVVQPADGDAITHSLSLDREAEDWQVETRVGVDDEVKTGAVVARTDSEKAYVAMMTRYLPVGLLGLVVASLLAAFMSTIDTHSNLAASFFVNDIYRRFTKPDAENRHYVFVARLATVSVMTFAGVVATQTDNIAQLFLIFVAFLSGVGPVYVARWLWWRVRAHVELVAMGTSAMTTTIITQFGDNWHWPLGLLSPNGVLTDEGRLLTVVTVSLIVSSVTLLLSTRPDPATLVDFYKKVRPIGFWGPVRALAGDVGPREPLLPIGVGIAGGLALIFGSMMATGVWILGGEGFYPALVVALVGGCGMLWAVRRVTAGADTPARGE